VESVRTRGQRLSVLASANADAVVERARGLAASSIQVAPVGLREIFLEKVTDALV
jgi:ABC-2 type transport system ATP-binding protein